MDLFSQIEDSTVQTVERKKPTAKRKNRVDFDPLKTLSADFDIHAQFALAIQQRDRQILDFLLSEEQDSFYWKSKSDFINKYCGCCDKLAQKRKIFVTTLKGGCDKDGCGFNHCGGITVSANRVCNNGVLWQFNLVYNLDKKGKIRLRRCRYFEVDTTQVP